jgi:hypothetical protein
MLLNIPGWQKDVLPQHIAAQPCMAEINLGWLA